MAKPVQKAELAKVLKRCSLKARQQILDPQVSRDRKDADDEIL